MPANSRAGNVGNSQGEGKLSVPPSPPPRSSESGAEKPSSSPGNWGPEREGVAGTRMVSWFPQAAELRVGFALLGIVLGLESLKGKEEPRTLCRRC